MSEFRVIAVTTLIAVAASVLSSTLLSWVAVAGVKPDLALVVVALIAMRRGSMPGQVAGFASGLLADTISVGPLGMTAMVRTVAGYLIGRMAGLVSADWVLLPTLVAVAATVFKALTVTVLALAIPWIPGYGIAAPAFLIEAALNGVAAPALYVLLSLVPRLKERPARRTLGAKLRP